MKTKRGKKDFLRFSYLSREEALDIIERAKDLKKRQKNRIRYRPMEGRTLAMIFEKPSTRTRVSFETGIYQLGGQPIYLSSGDIQISRGETVADTARVLSRYVDMVMIRAFSQDMVEELANESSVPVINGLTDLTHPCQVMSDLFTIAERRDWSLEGLKVTYVGDGNNLTNSWINAAALLGFTLTISCPEELMPDEAILKEGIKRSEGKIKSEENPKAGVKDADVIYTDAWMSMGDDPRLRERKLDMLKLYQVNGELLDSAPESCVVMHCLPAHRGEEITDDVMDGERSIVYVQAENRLHVQKAIMDILNQRQEASGGG